MRLSPDLEKSSLRSRPCLRQRRLSAWRQAHRSICHRACRSRPAPPRPATLRRVLQTAHEELKQRLAEFTAFAGALDGDEKSEAQPFLDHLFRALGHAGVIEAGATFEFRVAKKPGSAQLELLIGADAAQKKGGKKFADLLWPSRVLIEMKSRGAKLEKHYDQLFDYWSHIVPHRPPYAILCNFDELWIYDFTQQLFDPVDKIRVAKLLENHVALGFLLPVAARPIFDNDRVAVTRKAANAFADVFNKLIHREVPPDKVRASQNDQQDEKPRCSNGIVRR